MSLPTTLPAAVLGTILERVALLFLSGAAGDMQAAREAAEQMLASYQPQTVYELRIAAQAITFSFHALEALSQASTPDMPMTKILRLRGSAVSLSRESHKAERRLDQLQKPRQDGAPQSEPAAAAPNPPRVEKAIALVEATRQEIQPCVNNTPPTWSKPAAPRQNPSLIAGASTPRPGPNVHLA
jgi:hypothetical protein